MSNKIHQYRFMCCDTFFCAFPLPLKETMIGIFRKRAEFLGKLLLLSTYNEFDNCIIINLFAHFVCQLNWNAVSAYIWIKRTLNSRQQNSMTIIVTIFFLLRLKRKSFINRRVPIIETNLHSANVIQIGALKQNWMLKIDCDERLSSIICIYDGDHVTTGTPTRTQTQTRRKISVFRLRIWIPKMRVSEGMCTLCTVQCHSQQHQLPIRVRTGNMNSLARSHSPNLPLSVFVCLWVSEWDCVQCDVMKEH